MPIFCHKVSNWSLARPPKQRVSDSNRLGIIREKSRQVSGYTYPKRYNVQSDLDVWIYVFLAAPEHP